MFFRQFLAKRSQSPQQAAVNNPSHSAVSLEEYAALSHDVYFAEHEQARPPLPSGWKRLTDSGPTTKGYFGAVYVKHEENPTEVVFAHKAAIPLAGNDLITNLQAAFNRVPNQYLSADVFLGKAVDALIRKYGEDKLDKMNLSATGHAFGGLLAEICSSHYIPTITFENPGSKETFNKIYRHELQEGKRSAFKIEAMIIEMLVRMRKNSRNYCSDINAINSAQEQIGNSFMVLPFSYDFADDKLVTLQQLSANAAKNAYYLQSYTMQQNQMQAFYDKLKKAHELKPVKNPVGFQNAYQAYLNYETRKVYWDSFAEHYWSRNITQHADYQNDFNAFKKDFLQQLNAAHEKALAAPEKPMAEEDDNLSLNIGGFSLFAHPANKQPKLEDEFEMVEKPKEVAHEKKKSTCIVM